MLKREVDKLDTDLASKNQVITEYKTICSQLSAKLEKAQAHAKSSPDSRKNENKQQGLSEQPTIDTELEKFNDRIKELEMELAQTKLALVETKCRNQELTHQIVLNEEKMESSQQQQQSNNKKWFAKTLYSIKETAVASSSGLSKAANATGTSITKSTSVDVLTQNST